MCATCFGCCGVWGVGVLGCCSCRDGGVLGSESRSGACLCGGVWWVLCSLVRLWGVVVELCVGGLVCIVFRVALVVSGWCGLVGMLVFWVFLVVVWCGSLLVGLHCWLVWSRLDKLPRC